MLNETFLWFSNTVSQVPLMQKKYTYRDKSKLTRKMQYNSCIYYSGCIYLTTFTTVLSHCKKISNCVQKCNFQKIWQNCELRFSCRKFVNSCHYDTLISITSWIFALKIIKIQQFSTIVDSVFPQNHDFWRESSNYLSEPCI